jgi:hypothetical protein
MKAGPALFATCRTFFAVGRKTGEQAFVSFGAPWAPLEQAKHYQIARTGP